MHAEYFAGIAKYDYIGVAKPIDEMSTGAFTFIRFGVDDIPNTTQLIDATGNIDYDKITTFSAGDYGFLFHTRAKCQLKDYPLAEILKSFTVMWENLHAHGDLV